MYDNKQCFNCRKTFPLSEFPHKASRCRQCRKEYNTAWHNKNKEKNNQKAFQRYHSMTEEQHESRRTVRRKYRQLKKATDPVYLLNHRMTKAVKKAINGHSSDWISNVSYTPETLKEHLEKHFTKLMTWQNYGAYWEIDHYLPQYLFKCNNATDLKFRLCWGLDNLYPLKKEINSAKSNTIPSFDYDNLDQQKF